MPHRKGDAVASVATKVLVVDDDPDLQEILGIYLRQWGFEVASAANGNDGVRLAESYQADIVLSDVMMPALPSRDTHDRLLNRGHGGCGDQRWRAGSPPETTGLSKTQISHRGLKSPNESRDSHPN
jgi:CheY-like chemotaxis protein